ncbi:MAG: hypothetical protein HY865_01030 [Chloroflexi bacterium]|nr:hypothetical protein [Chloroflexota bacterium]
MYCYICGRVCDHHPTHLCDDCRREQAINNEHTALYILLNEARVYCPLGL